MNGASVVSGRESGACFVASLRPPNGEHQNGHQPLGPHSPVPIPLFESLLELASAPSSHTERRFPWIPRGDLAEKPQSPHQNGHPPCCGGYATPLACCLPSTAGVGGHSADPRPRSLRCPRFAQHQAAGSRRNEPPGVADRAAAVAARKRRGPGRSRSPLSVFGPAAVSTGRSSHHQLSAK
jgi:hypothetical protein